jgi:hypothetical protein
MVLKPKNTEALSMPLLVTVDVIAERVAVGFMAAGGLPGFTLSSLKPDSNCISLSAFQLYVYNDESSLLAPHLTWALRGTRYPQVRRSARRSQREFVVKNLHLAKRVSAGHRIDQKCL